MFYSEGILYQSALKESVMLYLFDNQLVFCARTGDGGLKLKNCFDLARTSFSAENGLFRIYEKQTEELCADAGLNQKQERWRKMAVFIKTGNWISKNKGSKFFFIKKEILN